MTETLVIYHGGCRDGFCAAWVVNKYLDTLHDIAEGSSYDVKFHPGFYGQEPPDCKGKDVIIVDFCYPLDVMKDIYEKCNSLTWLDHHKTAEPVAEYFMNETLEDRDSKLKMKFRIDNSGAGLAWDYFFPNEPRPWLVDYVEDRDLWRKKLEWTDEVNAYVACLEFKFETWNQILETVELDDACQFGLISLMKTEQYIREVCKNVYFADIENPEDRRHDMGGYLKPIFTWLNIPIVNICQVDCSEVLHELCEKFPSAPFSLYWFKRADGMYQYGLRSIGEFDVSSVAKLFGGGGHKNAAGFQLDYLLEELK